MIDDIGDFASRLNVTKIRRLPSGHIEADIDVSRDMYEQIRAHINAPADDVGDDAVNVFLEKCIVGALQNASQILGRT
jgi:hypothetical protein